MRPRLFGVSCPRCGAAMATTDPTAGELCDGCQRDVVASERTLECGWP
jgi:endogenous inhibitor of DNA gyrase (YacG/DUF329 family)